MFTANGWNKTEYAVLDAGDGMKIERWGKDGIILKRPDPQAIWAMSEWGQRIVPHAEYIRSSSGGGRWEYNRRLSEAWNVRYGNLTFVVRPTGFKHTGLFPEQAANWDVLQELCYASNRPLNVLNLFAYTGGATLALASAGASVVHVDAAKGMIAWAKENLSTSGLSDRPVRFIVDDCLKFVLREQRRGHFYDGIIMDPPSYGRGPDGQMWKIETGLYPLVIECVKLLSRDARFFFINSYTTGLAPTVIANTLNRALGKRACEGIISAQELGLPITGEDKSASGLILPCGATGRWIRK